MRCSGMPAGAAMTIPRAVLSDLGMRAGGLGTRELLGLVKPEDELQTGLGEAIVDWIKVVAEGAEMVVSVCTGALLLGAAGYAHVDAEMAGLGV